MVKGNIQSSIQGTTADSFAPMQSTNRGEKKWRPG